MTNKERGLFKLIFKAFVASLKPNKGPQLIGEDFYGTKYYEIPLRSESTHRKPNRYFEPTNKNDFQQEIPAEWEAWLRYRRKHPPTQDEIAKNYEIMIMKKKNATELQINYAEMKQKAKLVDKYPERNEHTGTFPVYEEYKEFGMQYKPKIK